MPAGIAPDDLTPIGPEMSEARGPRLVLGPGTGFGIAIARDLAEGVGARLRLSRSELGGLKVELCWPVPAA